MTGTISLLDLVIIGVYFAAVLGVGLYFSRRERTSTEYFLAGRHVAWWAIGASLFASNISSEHFIGLAGSGAASGFAVGNFEWLACFCCLTLGWLFVPFYLRSGVFTMPEFLERRYGPASRWYLTIVSIISYVLTKISVTLVAGSLLLEEVVGWDFMTSSIVLVVATGVYTIAGGLAAVIYTEVVQTVVLVGGATLLTVMGLWEIGGWSALTAKLDPSYFSMFRPMDHPDFPWTGIVFGAPILGIWYWCTDQFIVQRVLSAKNEQNARSGAICAGFLKILPVFIMVLPGLVAAALYADVNGDNAYPAIVSRLLPSGLKGIVIAGLLAAIMSSLASVFNSCSSLITMDIYKKLKANPSERELVLVGRISTGVLVVLGILWVPYIKEISSQLFVYLQSVSAYISPPITACFIFGVLTTRLNATGAIATLITGFVLGAARLILELLHKNGMEVSGALGWLATINFLHFAVLLFAISIFVLFLVSLLTREPAREKIRGLTFQTLEAGLPVEQAGAVSSERRYRWHRLNLGFSVFLVLILIVLWYVFR
ncbi:MAG TPA: sodium:solute symporter [bacterium]|nr:sodium:solute symporter [bacterium]HQO35871.1 sodium:solute symporter [bacterium]